MLSRYGFRGALSAANCTSTAVAAAAAALVSTSCAASHSASTASVFAVGVSPFMSCSRRWCTTAETADKKDATKEPSGEGAADAAALETEIKKLQEALKKKTEEADEFKKLAQYANADASNARRIAAEDVAKAKSYGITSFSKDMLDVNDTLERAIDAFGKLEPSEVKFLTEHKLFSQLVTGVKLSHNMLMHNLGRHGIELIEVKPADVFDPNRHDAIFNSPSTDEIKPGQVAVVVKKGYMLKDRVLRAAQVGVAQPK